MDAINAREKVVTRLRDAARSATTQRDLSQHMGVNEATVSRWLSGANEPDLVTFGRLVQRLRTTADYLLGLTDDPSLPRSTTISYDLSTGEAPSVREMITEGLYSAGDVSPMVLEIAGTRFVAVPKLRDPIAAGAGIITAGATDGIRLVREDDLRRALAGPLWRSRVIALEVHNSWLGESMLPTIKPGAQLLADRGADPAGLDEFHDGSIYLVRTKDAVTCKRVWRTGRTLNCHADNTRVAPLVIPLGRPPRLADHVIARVFSIANPEK